MPHTEEADIWSRAGDTNADPVNTSNCSPIVGLDFGTCNSCVSVWDAEANRCRTIRNSRGNKITPSNVTYLGKASEHKVIIGLSDSETYSHTIFGIKSHLDEEQNETAGNTMGVLCVCESGEQRVRSSEEVASEIIRYIRCSAEDYLNDCAKREGRPSLTLHRVVIGVPATCSDRQRLATRAAAEAAGFSEVHFMVESTAAAFSYGLLVVGKKTAMVFDMGGGTLDVTIMAVSDGKCQVLATAGHPKCGGFSIDRLLSEYIIQKIDHRADVSFEYKYRLHQLTDQGGQLRGRLRALCRAAKELLSDPEKPSVTIELSGDFFLSDGAVKASQPSKQAGAVKAVQPDKQADGDVCSETIPSQPYDTFSSERRAERLDPARDLCASNENSREEDASSVASSSVSSDGNEEATIEEVFRRAADIELDKNQTKLPTVPLPRQQDGIGSLGSDGILDSDCSSSDNADADAEDEKEAMRAEGADEEGGDVWRWTSEHTVSGPLDALMVSSENNNQLSKIQETASDPASKRRVKVSDSVVGEEVPDSSGEREIQRPVLRVELTRSELERVVEPVLEQLQGTVKTAINRWKAQGKCGFGNISMEEGCAVIDEVILVGGSSRVPCVRDALRKQLGAVPEGIKFRSISEPTMGPAGLEGNKEFCTSIDPDQAVSQGLAIRGAIIMGVDKSLLKDLLMLDMLSTAIGLKTFKRARPRSDSTSADSTRLSQEEEDESQYETILPRGAKLPASSSKLFQLESPTQKLVTTEVFEELEVGGFEATGSPCLEWRRMGAFTCVVPKSCRRPKRTSPDELGGLISVTFKMSESGHLSVSVSAPDDAAGAVEALRSATGGDGSIHALVTSAPTEKIKDTGGGAGGTTGQGQQKGGNKVVAGEEEEIDEESAKSIAFLIGVIVFLLVVYLVTKMYILEKPLFDFDFDMHQQQEEEHVAEDLIYYNTHTSTTSADMETPDL